MIKFSDSDIKSAQARMETARRNFDTLREEVSDLVLPLERGFNRINITQGDDLQRWQYDEYAAQALAEGVAAFEGYVIPRGQKWQNITLADDEMMEDISIQQDMEKITKRLQALRNDPQSGFSQNVHRSATNLFAFGEQSMWVDIRYNASGIPMGLSYQSESLDGIYVERDAEGNPHRVHRKFELTAENAYSKWGDELPKLVKAAAMDNNRKSDKFSFIHVIEPNSEQKKDRIDVEAMPFKSCYFSCSDNEAFSRGGYWTMPRTISCFERGSWEDYGRSPAIMVLPAIRASQIIMQDRIIAIELGVKPPLLAMDDDLDSGIIDLAPYGITYGGLDERGQRMIEQLFTNVDINSAEALHAEIRRVIDTAFYRDIYQMRREYKTHISALRTAEEIAEKGILMAPLARQENEWFSAMLPRELSLMEDLGLFDDINEKIKDYIIDGGKFGARYDNQLSRMQESSEMVGYMRTAEQVGLLASFDPSAAETFKKQIPLDRAIRRLAGLNGVTANWFANDDELQQADDVAAQEQDLKLLTETAPAIGATVKDLAALDG